MEKQTQRIMVPHDEELNLAYPPVGPNNYRNVGQELLQKGLAIPTGDDIASLAYAAYCNPELKNKAEFQKFREIMQKKMIWEYNLALWTSQGVYVIQDKDI